VLPKRNTDLQSVPLAEFYSAEPRTADRMSAGRTGHSPVFHLGNAQFRCDPIFSVPIVRVRLSYCRFSERNFTSAFCASLTSSLVPLQRLNDSTVHVTEG